ncbi:MAG: Rap1a/Tai family immunity protein [Pseudomonadota bacterium]
MKHLLPSIFVFMACATSSFAQELRQDVQKLLNDCESDEAFAYGACLGMARGTAAVMQFNCSLYQDGTSTITFFAADSSNATYGAMIQAFINWARANPSEWGTRGELGMITALRETFPC